MSESSDGRRVWRSGEPLRTRSRRRRKGLRCRVKKMSISSIEGVVETIADDTLRRNKLPEPVNLDEVRRTERM